MVSLPDETQSSTRSSWAGLSLDSCSSRNPTDQLTLPKIELFMCSSTWTDCLWMGCSAQMKWLILCIMNTSAPVSCFLSEWHHATLLLCVMHYFFQLKQYVDGYLFIYLIEMCEKVSKTYFFPPPLNIPRRNDLVYHYFCKMECRIIFIHWSRCTARSCFVTLGGSLR